MNLVALAFFITALLALGGFHLTRFTTDASDPGYCVWIEFRDMVQSRDFDNSWESIGLWMFPCFALVALVSPFLVGTLNRSRLAWWMLVLFSGTCLITIGISIIAVTQFPSDEPEQQRSTGFFCLAAALVLNFLGMLFVRRDGMAAIPSEPGEADFPYSR